MDCPAFTWLTRLGMLLVLGGLCYEEGALEEMNANTENIR